MEGVDPQGHHHQGGIKGVDGLDGLAEGGQVAVVVGAGGQGQVEVRRAHPGLLPVSSA